MVITRRKFFSFFGVGVVMAATPALVPAVVRNLAFYQQHPVEYIQDHYGSSPLDDIYALWTYKEQMIRAYLQGLRRL